MSNRTNNVSCPLLVSGRAPRSWNSHHPHWVKCSFALHCRSGRNVLNYRRGFGGRTVNSYSSNWLQQLSRLLVVAVITLVSAQPLHADQWVPPKIETYLSSDGASRLTVIPRGIESPLAYFQDKLDGREKAGQRKGDNDRPRGRLERNDQGVWRLVWEQPLVNDVSPVSALVADGGGYVVTFDNWHSAGFGDDVVVIYDKNGRVLKSLSLTDILPEEYVKALPRTVSSLWWAGEHRIVGTELVLSVVVPSEDAFLGDRTYVEMHVDLTTGQPIPPHGPVWDNALASARRENIKTAQWEEKRRKEMMIPLVAPTSREATGWDNYLQEAFWRTAKDWSSTTPLTFVLPSVDLPAAHASAVKEIRGILNEGFDSGYVVMFGSPFAADLAATLEREAMKIGRGKLKDSRIYIAIGTEFWPQISAAFARSGAKLIRIDPKTPIPQNPERL